MENDSIKVAITVDTEEDNQWGSSKTKTTENINYLPRFQKLCERYKLKPTYLCTYGAVKSKEFPKIINPILERGKCEIGSHLHAWSNPPFDSVFSDKLSTPYYAHELPISMFQKKMEILTDLIYDKTSAKPKSYRAGRWGFDVTHIPVLLDLGYFVDCSVTPLVSWQDKKGLKEGGPNYKDAPIEPYYLDTGNINLKADSGLLEIPVTILYTNYFVRKSKYLQEFVELRKHKLVGRVIRKVLNAEPQWFRPFPHMDKYSIIKVCDTAIKLNLPVLEMMFHSSELMPGGSPYNKTTNSIDELYDKLESVFKYVVENRGGIGVTLLDIASDYPVKQGDYKSTQEFIE